MKMRTVLDGNAFYEIDEECMEQRRKTQKDGHRGEQRSEQSGENAGSTGRSIQGKNTGRTAEAAREKCRQNRWNCVKEVKKMISEKRDNL